MNNPDAERNHFELFGLPVRFDLDAQALERGYREIQSRVHPDRFAHAGDAERRSAMQWATRVNEAYHVLRDPVRRAAYLLSLHGVDPGFETNTAMPADFLSRQLEWREAVEQASDAGDAPALDQLAADLRRETAELHREIARDLETPERRAAAAGALRKLKFLERIGEEIGAAHERIEG